MASLALAVLGLLLGLISPMLRPLQAMTCLDHSAFSMHDKHRVNLNATEELLESYGLSRRCGDRVFGQKFIN